MAEAVAPCAFSHKVLRENPCRELPLIRLPGHGPLRFVELSSALSALDTAAAACLFPLALVILLNGIDDLVLDLALAWDWVRHRLYDAAPSATVPAQAVREKRIAIFVPLWQEHEVIGGMVAHNISAVRYRNYDFFIGAYPNDEPTLAAVRDLEQRFPNVHLAVCAHHGPTSKADCLNAIYDRMLLFERAGGSPFAFVVVHDAEDLIHPDSLDYINRLGDSCDMVQIPVLPLATPLRDLVHGVYCDEFSEYQTKDVPARQILGAFLPSNGVGTGFSRRALDTLAAEGNHRVFNPLCLTEDYETGLRLAQHGFRQTFVHLTGGHNAVATREYFPRTMRAAIRQRTRWITGISLQSWTMNGWRGNLAQRYWFWRDRKGLLANPVGLFANLLFGYGMLTWMAAQVTRHPWTLARRSLHPWLFIAILALQLLHLGIRIVCVSRYFGWRFAAAVPIRTMVANYINCMATLRAEYRFVRAKLRGEPLVWLKTTHAYPSPAALRPQKRRIGEILTSFAYIRGEDLAYALATQPAGVRLGEHLVRLGLLAEDNLYRALALQQGISSGPVVAADVNPHVARALPRSVVQQWKVMPFQIREGCMLLASPDVPGEDVTRVLSSLTTLKIQFHLVTPANFAELRHAFL